MPKAKPRSRRTRSELRENDQQGVQPLHQQVLQRRACQSHPDVQPPVSQPLAHQPPSVNIQPPVIVKQPAVQPFLVDVQKPVVQHQLLNVQPPMHQHGQPQHEQPQSVERRQLSDGTLQVYIVGSSIIKYAEQHAKNTVGQHLGLNRYKIFLNWIGVSSLKVENVLSAIE
ncbi:uncharacterized protein LOC132716606 [Ruditapes philippinarum]|uniref:uncharacterized protein LOC132716606 n=1 Tax=Ruditapes philippinarum TaxID=129788 RepID=UPI00295ADAF2|nr:uncharacterized protein LOC132716606 [Ruditapes philippinarum]